MPFNVGPLELVIVLVIALVILGPKRLPEVGKSIGNGMREFKDAISGHDKDDDDDEITHAQGVLLGARLSRQRAGAPASVRRGMRIARSMLDQIVAQARDEAPNECCGIVGTRDGAGGRRVSRVRNAAASPLRYEIDPKDQLRVFEALDDAELDVGAIYHSHTRSAPRAVADRHQPRVLSRRAVRDRRASAGEDDDVRAWRIVDGQVSEAPLEVEEG